MAAIILQPYLFEGEPVVTCRACRWIEDIAPNPDAAWCIAIHRAMYFESGIDCPRNCEFFTPR